MNKDNELGPGDGIEDTHAWPTMGRFNLPKTMNIEVTGGTAKVAAQSVKKNPNMVYDHRHRSILDLEAWHLTRRVLGEGGEGLTRVFNRKRLISAVFNR